MAITIVEAPTATCSRWDSATTLDLVVHPISDLPVITITDQWDATGHPVRRNSSVEATITDLWAVTAHRISTVEAPTVDAPTDHAVVK